MAEPMGHLGVDEGRGQQSSISTREEAVRSPPEPQSKRAPALIAIVVLLARIVGVHLTGVVGPGAH